MNIRKIITVIIAIAIIFICNGCSSDRPALDSSKEITSFSFKAIDNQILARNIEAVITDEAIELLVPFNTNTVNLKASFITAGQIVQVNEIQQFSSVTSNDFTSAVIYKVTAEDGTSKNYTVTVDFTDFCIKKIGGENTDKGHSIEIDSNNNIYITGMFQGTVDFNPGDGVDIHSSNGSSDIFISKFNADGSYGWTKAVGGSGIDQGHSVALDSNGNVYVTGGFQGEVDFNPGDELDYHNASEAYNTFVLKIYSNGTYGWAKTMGGYGHSITVDTNNNIYIVGIFQDTVDMEPGGGADNKTSNGEGDIFITKLNSDGSYGETRTIGGTGIDIPYSITTDVSNNLYITGNFANTVDFDDSTGVDNHSSEGGSDIFIMKMNSNGTYGWTKTVGSSESDYGKRIIVNNGSVYITGHFAGTVDFNAGAEIDSHSSNGDTDVFITKIGTDGSYGWTKTIGGPGRDCGYGVTTDSVGNIFITGAFRDANVDLKLGEGTEMYTSNGGDDIYLIKINSDGTYDWSKAMGGTSHDSGSSLVVDSNDNLFMTGYFSTTVDFDPGAGIENYTVSGINVGWDIFIWGCSNE